MSEREALKLIGDWIAEETRKRKYKDEEVRKLSESLIVLKKHIDWSEEE